jgi:hypothetical protein
LSAPSYRHCGDTAGMTYVHAPSPKAAFLPSIPLLWETVKAMCQRLLGHVPRTDQIALLQDLRDVERRHILGWLEPIERIVRHLLFAQALTHLLMTPEGRELRKRYAPPPPKPPGSNRSTKILIPGLAVIWQRPVKRPEPPPLPPPQPRASLDLSDPASWSCPFKLDKHPDAQPAKAAPARSMPLASRRPERLAIEAGGNEHEEPSRSALMIARRIEALRRVIARPRPHILRLARWLASRQAETLELTPFGATRRNHWRHGYDIWEQSRDHALLSLRAYHRTLEPG